ncbi:hypothetical protein bsdtw1_04381 [Clostridium fungisolvens]|uniref:Tyrosine specific protein phosphatases domain-containing protein n=1 Tax=Clostridium fungisolvens TaxID=1604897 RepID=A0A6V8SLY9_9CLOT|nr:hypothetical protein bsdtw1_04381 [Clostridium fungisolvens]
MARSLKKYMVSFLVIIILSVFCSCTMRDKNKFVSLARTNVDNSVVSLVMDTSNYEGMPKNFRKSSDLGNVEKDKTLDLKGLNDLNISGTQQFSGFNLPLVINSINTKMPITVIDLRQEAHGFINNIPVSWKNEKNDANIGLTKEQVLADEQSKLKSIKLNVPIILANHPNETITPTKVQDEEQLVKENKLGYIRIPVTDGKIPTDEMVDYFMQIVKKQSKNTWLHFHCKEGIGRTTTFMIMYDMVKNSKQVTFDNIIKRQLALAGFNEQEIKSFYNNERISFLQNFYKYCNENKDNFNTSWIEWKKTITASNSPFSMYIKNKIRPTFLYVISEDTMSESEKTLIATLQGVVNNKSYHQIYTLNSNQPDYQIWLEDLKKNYGVTYKNVSDPWELVYSFKDYVDGYVLYDERNNPSINNACSLCSLKNSIAVDTSIEYKVKLHGITKIIGDCRNTEESWAYENLWNKGLNHSIVIQLEPNKSSPLRDYAIMSKALVFYENDMKNTSLRDKIFSSMDGSSVCMGWGSDEFTNVSTSSKHGVSMVAADWSYNLTVLSAFDTTPIKQGYIPKDIPNEENVHYVTFIMSDGDNQQWNLGTNYSSKKWYGSSYRGDFNLGWGITPSMYYLAPTVFNRYYESASKGKYSDYFIVPPSGSGYIYPSKFDKEKLSPYISRLNDYMKQTDERYLAVIDDSSFHDAELWGQFTSKANIKGLFYLDYHKHDNYKGEIVWSNGKPIVSCRDLLWSGLEDEEQLAKTINFRIEQGQTDVKKAEAYTFVYVHVWSKDLNDVKNVISMLEKNPRVRVVAPKVFMELINKNIER